MKENKYRPAKPIKRFLAFVIETLVGFAYIFSAVGAFDNEGSVAFAIFAYIVMYIALMTRSTTLGKLILNMKVVNRRTGKDLSFFDMLFRESIGKFISAAFFALGYIWIMIDNENRAWHDLVFGTLVVEIESKEDRILDEHDDDYYVQG